MQTRIEHPTTTLMELTDSLWEQLEDDRAVRTALEELLRGGYLRTSGGRPLRLASGPDQARVELG